MVVATIPWHCESVSRTILDDVVPKQPPPKIDLPDTKIAASSDVSSGSFSRNRASPCCYCCCLPQRQTRTLSTTKENKRRVAGHLRHERGLGSSTLAILRCCCVVVAVREGRQCRHVLVRVQWLEPFLDGKKPIQSTTVRLPVFPWLCAGWVKGS